VDGRFERKVVTVSSPCLREKKGKGRPKGKKKVANEAEKRTLARLRRLENVWGGNSALGKTRGTCNPSEERQKKNPAKKKKSAHLSGEGEGPAFRSPKNEQLIRPRSNPGRCSSRRESEKKEPRRKTTQQPVFLQERSTPRRAGVGNEPSSLGEKKETGGKKLSLKIKARITTKKE